MKKFNFLFNCFCMAVCSYGQSPVVSAPILEKLTTTSLKFQTKMSSTMAMLQAKQEALDKALQAASWLQNLQSAKRLMNLVETMVCNGRELNLAMSGGHKSCFVDFEYEMVIMKVQMSADYLGIILAANRMTTGERMKTLNDVLQRFEEAQKNMDEMVKKLGNQKKAQEIHEAYTINPPCGIRFIPK